jgi:hypothetical protein
MPTEELPAFPPDADAATVLVTVIDPPVKAVTGPDAAVMLKSGPITMI